MSTRAISQKEMNALVDGIVVYISDDKVVTRVQLNRAGRQAIVPRALGQAPNARVGNGTWERAIGIALESGRIIKCKKGRAQAYCVAATNATPAQQVLPPQLPSFVVNTSNPHQVVVSLYGTIMPLYRDDRGEYFNHGGTKVYVLEGELRIDGEVLIEGATSLGEFSIVVRGLRIVFGVLLIIGSLYLMFNPDQLARLINILL
jgi:hypothetical protein